jgi:hypothetical protein
VKVTMAGEFAYYAPGKPCGYLHEIDGFTYEPFVGRVTGAEVERHNRALSRAEIAAVDSCPAGGVVALYVRNGVVETYTGERVADAILSPLPSSCRPEWHVAFRRNGKIFTGTTMNNYQGRVDFYAIARD